MKIKTFLFFLPIFILASPALLAQGSRYTNPSIRMDGTYVPGHYRDGSGGNVYLKETRTIESINPYTGRLGYENPYSNYNIHQSYPYYPQIYDPSGEYR